MTERPPRTAAVLLAGGSGTRLGLGGRNKVYVEVGGRPLLAWSLATLDAHRSVVSIVVAVRPGDEALLQQVIDQVAPSTPLTTVTGGASRCRSEQRALEALGSSVAAGEIDHIIVHDGARPFVTPELIDRVIGAAVTHRGAVPGLVPARPVFACTPGAASAERLDPSLLRRVQTPQAFAAGPLLDAYRIAGAEGFEGVDTAEVVDHFAGVRAVVVDGDPDNIKVTTKGDLDVAERIALSRAGR